MYVQVSVLSSYWFNTRVIDKQVFARLEAEQQNGERAFVERAEHIERKVDECQVAALDERVVGVGLVARVGRLRRGRRDRTRLSASAAAEAAAAAHRTHVHEAQQTEHCEHEAPEQRKTRRIELREAHAHAVRRRVVPARVKCAVNE